MPLDTEASKDTTSISTLRRRRGVIKASITKLVTRLNEIEEKADEPSTLGHARKLSTKLESLDSEFKCHHFTIVDMLAEDESLESNLAKEQAVLDAHDGNVADISFRIENLILSCTSKADSAAHKIASRSLSNLKERLSLTSSQLGKIAGVSKDTDILEQFHEQVSGFKDELAEIRRSIITTCSPEESDALMRTAVVDIDKLMFDIGLAIKKKTSKAAASLDKAAATLFSDPKTVKLPKLDVPSFDGNLLHWLTFWEQFSVAIHDRDDISKAQKLVYLRQSLKDGPAKSVIEGLSQSGEQYDEAVTCLQSRYDRPRLIHEAHVRKIVEVSALRDDSGKELRRLHDILQQHLRALKAMDKEPSSPFITSLIEMKLDTNTRFEWQKHSQESSDIPHYTKILGFLNLRAQAAESATLEQKKQGSFKSKSCTLRSFTHVSTSLSQSANNSCVACRHAKHPLYACPQFRALSHDKMMEILRSNNLCLNCLRPGHYSKQCTSLNKCRRCQRSHHTLIHSDGKVGGQSQANTPSTLAVSEPSDQSVVTSNTVCGFGTNMLLMTCQVLVHSPDGTALKARALLDSASSTSFISERLAKVLQLEKVSQNIKISGIAGLSINSPLHSVVSFSISPVSSKSHLSRINVSAIAVPQVTSDLPLQPVRLKPEWTHISGLNLADPDFGRPGKVEILLGIDIYTNVVLNGRRIGPHGSPVAFETKFGWVLAGMADSSASLSSAIASNYATVMSGDELLAKFWEIEEGPRQPDTKKYSHEERIVMQHFKENHYKAESGRYVVPLPRKPGVKSLGESRTQAVRRFLTLERALSSKGQFADFSNVMEEYLKMEHAEVVPTKDLNHKPCDQVYYLPMHAVYKEESTTTKIRAVFDASAKTSTGVSFNDTLLVGPTVHPPLIDVLIRFRLYRIALTADISKMYRAVELAHSDRDFHRFIWRSDRSKPLTDYRMMRLTFGVSASSFTANMSLRQNAIDNSAKFPLAAQVVEKSFYVDDCLAGADTVSTAIELQCQLQSLLNEGGFLLRKWNTSDPSVLQHISPALRDARSTQLFHDDAECTKTLGIEWNVRLDRFHLTVGKFPTTEILTKRLLISDVAKTYDVLGWFSPSTVKAKILLQRVWEQKISWDDPVPTFIQDAWSQWRSELPLLSEKPIPRCYFNKFSQITTFELHGFCDASENAYAAVVYLRMIDMDGDVQISLVCSKTKVAPVKCLTIPRLELCGAHLLAHLLHHTRQVIEIPLSHICAWTDSSIVLYWLDGSLRRLKTFVGNRVSAILELVPPERWSHVNGSDNPADCASRGMLPSELLRHSLWWNGPCWLKQPPTSWPTQFDIPLPESLPEEERSIALVTTIQSREPIIPLDSHSNFNHFKRVTAWVFRFVRNCQSSSTRKPQSLTAKELNDAEKYWISFIQEAYYEEEINSLQRREPLSSSSCLFALHTFIDINGLLRVGGRQRLSMASYNSKHPLIIAGKHPLTRVIIRTEHLRLLHAGPTLLLSSLSQRYHIVGGRTVVRSVTRACVTCRRSSCKPQPQLLGQLPPERVTPGPVFNKVGVDYAGPLFLKLGHTRKPTVVKSYVCVFVSLTVKAVHLELVSDLTTEAFLACLRRFIARRGLPSLIWSDNGSNFVGAAREIKELHQFLQDHKTQTAVCDFLSSKSIEWRFIPQHAPHFGGLWEAAVRSMKAHLRRIVSNVKLTFEECSTLLAQIEACLNSRPLTPLNNDEDGIEALTPGHFLIGQPLQALPDRAITYCESLSSLRRWKLCQALLSHFWKRWSKEYLVHLSRFSKWHRSTRNLTVGDVVVIKEDSPLPTKWPLGKVIEVHPGSDGLVRVAKIKTATGVYTRPVVKLVTLLPVKSQSNPQARLRSTVDEGRDPSVT